MKKITIRVLAGLLLTALMMWSQSARPGGIVQGNVKDSTGGVIPGATITLLNPAGSVATTTTQADGGFILRGVAPGTYKVTVTYSGLAQTKPVNVTVVAGQTANTILSMNVGEQKQEVTVTDSSADNKISVEASNNATALVLKKEDLDALPDDPDDLTADLQALAGPSAGPGGKPDLRRWI